MVTYMADSQDGTSFFINTHEKTFGAAATAADDRMHHEANALVPEHPELVETQYLPFNVPSAGIQSFNYMWAHPNVGVVSGGPWAWRGVNPTQLHCEIFDMRNYMPISAVGEFDKYTLPSGYSVEVVKPLEEIHISYEDASRGNAFDVTLTAVMPPAMLSSGLHFEQALRTRGSVTLLGETHTVDGFAMRDRSWGETRPEAPRLAPVVHWLTPVFDEDFAIHAYGVEDPTRGPIYEGLVDFSPEKAEAFSRGWVWRNGELIHLDKVTLTCEWDRTFRYPKSYQVEMVDQNGKTWTMTGELVAGSNWHIWNNIYTPILLLRWECEGKVGYGDSQVGAWTDIVRQRLP